MRRTTAIAYAFAFCASLSSALAGECANPNALSTSRTLVIDNGSHLRVGSLQYSETLPLRDREVVITFDDGPLAPYSTKVLDLLAAECVKATYFLVGSMAQSNPELARRIQRDGHTVGTHSRSHPLTFHTMPVAKAEQEIDGGVALVKAALGEQGELAPFFRIPGLNRSSEVENLLEKRALVTWSVDAVADDWHRGITADDIASRALRRLEERGRGILLLHDIHPATALAMPKILKGLKERGFKVVHVVHATPDRPKTVTEPQQWAVHGKRPRVEVAEGVIDPRRPVPSRTSLGLGMKVIATFTPAQEARHIMAAAGDDMRLPGEAWPADDTLVMAKEMAPSAASAAADWPQQDHVANIVEVEDAAWPAVKTAPAADPARKNVTSSKAAKPARTLSNRNERSRRPPIGHQLSLSDDRPKDTLRSQYQF